MSDAMSGADPLVKQTANDQLAGKRVLLTGASGGIGRAIARSLASEGASVLLVARRAEELLLLSQQLPGSHSCFSADLTCAADRQALLGFVQATGGVDMLINNAGASQFALAAEQDYAAQITLNLLAPMQLCQQLLPMLQQKPVATIVNIGSAFGSIGYPGFSGYCASKFGLRGFTEALKRELALTKIRVLYFAPRATQTAINSQAVVAMNQELGNAMDTPDVVAAQLLAQLKQGQSRRFVGWPEKLFVRLNAVLPELVDKAIRGKLAVILKYATTNKPIPTFSAAAAKNDIAQSSENITVSRSL
jgi:short-subunit dehydrogenase